MARVLVGMSGGVDSSVAAWLLKERGHDVCGVTMLLHGTPDDDPGVARDVEDARRVAALLGIGHLVVDLTAEFRASVVEAFAASYEAGLTPNPCVVCNRLVKFGLLLDRARDLGFDLLATGHYARVEPEPGTGAGARVRLLKASDPSKDQSYFLCMLSQRQLASALLPLGPLAKSEVRAIAEREGFPTARKRESQDICFVPDGDYLAFLERLRGGPYPGGPVVTADGTVVGTHRGIAACTIGQRKGLGIALGEPAYVCAKDAASNTVTMGPAESLMARTCAVDRWNWVAPPASAVTPLHARVRTHYRHTEQPATVVPLPGGGVRVEFDEPQRAMAPGQFAVAYDGDEVLGGGAIAQTGRTAGPGAPSERFSL